MRFRIFLAIQALLGMAALFTLFRTRGLGFLIILAILFIILGGLHKEGKIQFSFAHKARSFFPIFACIILTIMIFSNIFIWLMLGVGILYFIFFGQFSKNNATIKQPIFKTELHIIETKEPSENHSEEIVRGQWFGSQIIGSDTYEWDDINIAILAGDTIIDLGNTLLPKEDSVILIRKGFGRTRILVPASIGVRFEHCGLAGNAKFDGETYSLNNETLKVYSKDYEESTRKLKIVSSTLFGEVEVIRV